MLVPHAVANLYCCCACRGRRPSAGPPPHSGPAKPSRRSTFRPGRRSRPRSSHQAERTATASLTTVARSIAVSASPLTSSLDAGRANDGRCGAPFLLGGGLALTCDALHDAAQLPPCRRSGSRKRAPPTAAHRRAGFRRTRLQHTGGKIDDDPPTIATPALPLDEHPCLNLRVGPVGTRSSAPSGRRRRERSLRLRRLGSGAQPPRAPSSTSSRCEIPSCALGWSASPRLAFSQFRIGHHPTEPGCCCTLSVQRTLSRRSDGWAPQSTADTPRFEGDGRPATPASTASLPAFHPMVPHPSIRSSVGAVAALAGSARPRLAVRQDFLTLGLPPPRRPAGTADVRLAGVSVFVLRRAESRVYRAGDAGNRRGLFHGPGGRASAAIRTRKAVADGAAAGWCPE